MKKLTKIISAFCLLSVFLLGCKNPINDLDDSKNQPEDNFIVGWWEYKDEDLHCYFYYNENKEMERAGDDSEEYKSSMLDYYIKNPGFTFDYNMSKYEHLSGIIFKHIEESELPDWYKPDDNEPTKQREYSYIILPTPSCANINEKTEIIYTFGNLYDSDDFEIITVQNQYSIAFDVTPYLGYIEITGYSEGTITIKLFDKTANCTSNECEITFTKPAEPVSPLEANALLFVGTWTIEYHPLFDTIEFYNDGTGKAYHSQYTGYNTFKWEIIDETTIKITNSLGQSGLNTYTITTNTLEMYKFLGCEIIAYKKV